MNMKGIDGNRTFIIFSRVLAEIIRIHIKQVKKSAYKHFL
jgi:hypothetical protein